MKFRYLRLAALFVGLCGTGRTMAHDLWIEPSAWAPVTATRINVTLCVGDAFNGRPAKRNASRIEEFFAAGPGARQPIVGFDGSEPAGSVRFAVPGGYVLGYRNNHAFVEMSSAKFDDHLREKGLERILALRESAGKARRKVREAYTRYVKALVGVGGAAPLDRLVGLRLEFVAEPVPDAARDAPRGFRLLFDGQPLAGALVIATRRPAVGSPIQVRTDAAGRVRLPLDEGGTWLVTAVHMIEAPAGLDADFESFWASLTFDRSTAPVPVARCAQPATFL